MLGIVTQPFPSYAGYGEEILGGFHRSSTPKGRTATLPLWRGYRRLV